MANLPEQAWMERHRMRRGHPEPYCRECRGAGASLTKHCVGRILTDAEEAEIVAGRLNFVGGAWVRKNNGVPS
jgi:hypothetical protein